MGHDWFDGFDKRACNGDHPEADGECPKLKKGAVNTCGVCGCTIFGLSMSETPPTDCVRRNLHQPATDGGMRVLEDPDDDAPDPRARLIQTDDGWEVVGVDADPKTMAEAAHREQTVAEYVSESGADDFIVVKVGRSFQVRATHAASGRFAAMNLLEYALQKVASRMEDEDDLPTWDDPDVEDAWDLVELDRVGRTDGDWRASHLRTGFARPGGTRAGAVKNLAAALKNHTWL